jgi:hypothetical protein
MLIAPIQHLAQIELRDANTALLLWQHKMGAWTWRTRRLPGAG